jgi:gas vesicle protein
MASTTELRKSYTDYAKSFTGTKPLYAVAGAGDLAVEKLKDVPTKLRTELTVEKIKSVTERVRTEFTGSEGRVKKVADSLADLPRNPRKLTDKLTDLAEEQVKAADRRLAEWAERGEKVVDRVREDNKELLAKAKKAAEKVRIRGASPATPAAPAPTAPRKAPAKTTPVAPEVKLGN